MLNQAVGLSETLYAEAQRLVATDSQLQPKDLSLPLLRECVDVKLSYAKLLLSMLSLHINDERQKMVLNLQLPAVLQVTVTIIITAFID